MPGEFIKNKNDLQLGIGTNLVEDKIYATIKGTVQIIDNTISITASHQQDPQLKIGSLLLGQVLTLREDRVIIKILKVDGLSVNKQSTNQNCIEGVLKKQNIRKHEIDLIEISKCYIPGDIIQAKLISFGDSYKLYLTTAEDELGVLFAKNQETKELMIPYSWDEMLCIKSGLIEKRKVAKPNFDVFQ